MSLEEPPQSRSGQIAAVAATPIPLGARPWQRIFTFVLLGLSVLGYGALMIMPPAPLMFALAGPEAAAARLGIPTSAALLHVGIAWTLTLLFVATWVISVLLLRKRQLAFYVPLAAGVIASFIGGIALALPYLGM